MFAACGAFMAVCNYTRTSKYVRLQGYIYIQKYRLKTTVKILWIVRENEPKIFSSLNTDYKKGIIITYNL